MGVARWGALGCVRNPVSLRISCIVSLSESDGAGVEGQAGEELRGSRSPGSGPVGTTSGKGGGLGGSLAVSEPARW